MQKKQEEFSYNFENKWAKEIEGKNIIIGNWVL